jgi:hypothetical protein
VEAASHLVACSGSSVDAYRARMGGCEVLIDVLGDKARYRADSLTLPGVTRKYKGFSGRRG